MCTIVRAPPLGSLPLGPTVAGSRRWTIRGWTPTANPSKTTYVPFLSFPPSRLAWCHDQTACRTQQSFIPFGGARRVFALQSDPVQYMAVREMRYREKWVRVAQAKILAEQISECYLRNGVNHIQVGQPRQDTPCQGCCVDAEMRSETPHSEIQGSLWLRGSEVQRGERGDEGVRKRNRVRVPQRVPLRPSVTSTIEHAKRLVAQVCRPLVKQYVDMINAPDFGIRKA